MKCIQCPRWDEHRDTGSPIKSLCIEHAKELMELAGGRGSPIIIRHGYTPPPKLRDRVIGGIRLLWWRGEWRAYDGSRK